MLLNKVGTSILHFSNFNIKLKFKQALQNTIKKKEKQNKRMMIARHCSLEKLK